MLTATSAGEGWYGRNEVNGNEEKWSEPLGGKHHQSANQQPVAAQCNSRQ